MLFGQWLIPGQDEEPAVETADDIENVYEEIVETANEKDGSDEDEETFDEDEEVGDRIAECYGTFSKFADPNSRFDGNNGIRPVNHRSSDSMILPDARPSP